MTRKHFIAMADSISRIANDDDRLMMANEMGRIARDANSRFDWARWYDACNVRGM